MAKYFGTDGIRGVAGKELSNQIAYKIGVFLGDYYKNKGGKIIIGKDPRISSSMLESAVTTGILASGSDVYHLGFCSTPALAYMCKEQTFSIGIMISASHNPYYDNGIKIFSNKGSKLDNEVIELIEKYIDDELEIELKYDDKIGFSYDYSQEIEKYYDYILSNFNQDLSDFKVLLDLSNGSNYHIAKEIYNRKNIKTTFINDEPNGININKNCGSTHLESLIEAIKKEDYDIGFAYDGDGDRVLAVDSLGNVIDGDKLIFIIAEHLKSKNQLNKNTIVVTKMSNIGLLKACAMADIDVSIVDVGDKYVLEELEKHSYSLGGEQSGHIINTNVNNFGDGLLISLMILNIMKETNQSIIDLSKKVTVYPQMLKNIKVKNKDFILNNQKIINKIKEIETILKDEGRIFTRASGTEPLIRVMIEAKDIEICEKYCNDVIELIRNEENN